MYRFGFDLIVKNGEIYLKDDDDMGFGELKFVFDEKNCSEPFYGIDENLNNS